MFVLLRAWRNLLVFSLCCVGVVSTNVVPPCTRRWPATRGKPVFVGWLCCGQSVGLILVICCCLCITTSAVPMTKNTSRELNINEAICFRGTFLFACIHDACLFACFCHSASSVDHLTHVTAHFTFHTTSIVSVPQKSLKHAQKQ